MNQSADNQELSFEDAFAKLEEVLRSLESGGKTLEESMALYEQGMRLTRQCHEYLDSAQLRITEIASNMNTNGATEDLNKDYQS